MHKKWMMTEYKARRDELYRLLGFEEMQCRIYQDVSIQGREPYFYEQMLS